MITNSSEQDVKKQQVCCGGGNYKCSKLELLTNELVYAANFLSANDKKKFIGWLVAASERTRDDVTVKTILSLKQRAR